MFIHTHQHPILDMLEEHGVPVFIINLCDVRKVVDKKKVNQPYNIRKRCLELLEAQRAQKAPRGSGSYEGF